MRLSKLISVRIRRLLTERGWKPYKLATRSGIPHSTLCHMLKAKSRSVTTETLLNICRGFDLPLAAVFADELFDFENINDD